MSLLKFDEFPAATYEDWKAQAEATLAGAPFEKKLVTQTPEGLAIQPIYMDPAVPLPLPGTAPYTRGIHAAPKPWEIIEEPYAEVPFNRSVLSAGDTGQDFTVDVGRYHDLGASAVQEIAFALATGVEYLRVWGIGSASRMRFSFAVGADFFMAIAKFRAARTLWCSVVEACDGKEEVRKMRLHARTSLWNKSSIDAHTNILRATTEAAAAALAGCDSIQVGAFDEVLRAPDALSRRIARNMQLILRDECQFDRVLDPAGGSFYVEQLTHELAAASWKLFQEVERRGGMLSCLESGWAMEQVNAVADKRRSEIANRRASLVGVNVYANQREKVLPSRIPGRAAEPWENLRVAAAAAGSPKVFLANMGPLSQYKARADFATGFFQAGGFDVIDNSGFASPEAAATAALASDAKVIVICSTDVTYPEIVPPLVSAIKAADPARFVVVAGFPKEQIEVFKQAGVDEFIHVRSNCYETLSAIFKILGVSL